MSKLAIEVLELELDRYRERIDEAGQEITSYEQFIENKRKVVDVWLLKAAELERTIERLK